MVRQSRSAELLGDQSLQFTAGEKAGRRLPSLGSAADSFVILTRARRRNGGGCMYVVQNEILCRPWPRHRLFVGLRITWP